MSTPVRRLLAVAIALLAMLSGGIAFSTAVSAAPYSDQPTLAASTQNPTGGGAFTVVGSGFLPGESVDLVLHSDPYSLGTVRANSTGQFSDVVDLPASFSGAHTITATGEISGRVASISITIGSSTGTVAAGGNSGGGGLPNTGAAVIGISSLGVMFLLVGALALVVGRRRACI